MLTNGHTEARKLRAGLKHPIIDADGHWAEFAPHMREEFRRIGGDTAVEALAMASARIPNSLNMSVAERRRRRIGQEAFWFLPTKNTLDRATAMMPRLLYERLDDLGLDFCVIYPTAGLGYYRLPPEQAAPRPLSAPTTCSRRTSSARTPIGSFPPRSSRCTRRRRRSKSWSSRRQQLGYRVVHDGEPDPPADPRARRGASGGREVRRVVRHDRHRQRFTTTIRCGRSAASCASRRASTTSARSILLRNSPSNFCYNHIGHFASASEAMAKALFFGGVTRRFPELNFAFLEGGVGWACSLFADLIGHWEKRNREALENTNPARLDRARLLALAEKYGKPAVVEAVRRGEGLDDNGDGTGGVEDLDDYSRCQITRKEDFTRPVRQALLLRLRGRRSDQRVGLQPARRNPMGARLNAFFSSDIGHFDVPDMTEVVPEAYELVEHGLLDDDDFRDFMFANAVRFWGEVNPDFFKGTVVEKQAAEVLARATT